MNKIDTFDALKAAIRPKILEMICDFDNRDLWKPNVGYYETLNVSKATNLLIDFLFNRPPKNYFIVDFMEQIINLDLKINDEIKNKYPDNSFESTYKTALINICLAIFCLLENITAVYDDMDDERSMGLIFTYHQTLDIIMIEEREKLRAKLKANPTDFYDKHLSQSYNKRLELYERINNEYQKINLLEIHRRFQNRSPYQNSPEN